MSHSQSAKVRMGEILVAPCDVTMTDKTVGFFGYAVDEGEMMVGYRSGSSGGPAAVRQQLKVTGPLQNAEFGTDLRQFRIADFGDVHLLTEGLVATQTAAYEMVKDILSRGILPIVVGGGHDISHFMHEAMAGHLGHSRYIAINVDAHVDSTPLLPNNTAIHCGASFRRYLDHDDFEGKFIHFATQGHQVSSALVDHIRSKGGRIEWLTSVRKKGARAAFTEMLDSLPSDMPVVLSIDVDSIRSADCPGATVPSPIGLTAEEMIDICHEAGARSQVASLDISEINVAVESDRTGRLIAVMIYYFLLGFHDRKMSR